MKTKILDCTVRDGGHLNNWEFSHSCVRSAYHAALRAGVHYFEAGYRLPRAKTGHGDFAYCEDELLRDLFPLHANCKIAVMIDVGKSDASLFVPRDTTRNPLAAVRIAAYPYELERAITLIKQIADLGYETFLNLMASSELQPEHFEFLSAWKGKDALQAVYFADSFGAFIPEDVSLNMKRLRAAGFTKVGFHAHNNLQMAFGNTLCAVKDGAEMVDASIYGMGRGAGNLPVEILLGYLERIGQKSYNPVAYFDVLEQHILPLWENLRWGYSLEALMGGLANVHPYYVESLRAEGLYTTGELWNALNVIKRKCPISFSPVSLGETLESRSYSPLTEEKAAEAHRALVNELSSIPSDDSFDCGAFEFDQSYAGRSFLVLATGPSIVAYRDKLQRFAESQNCVTVGVNNMQGLYAPDFHVFVSRVRMQQYGRSVSPDSRILAPSFFGKHLASECCTNQVHFFNLTAPCEPAAPPVVSGAQQCTSLNVAVSAILLAYSMGASAIYVAGMDGYAAEDDKILPYFYPEDKKIEDRATANFRYDKLGTELARVSRFLEERSVPFFIITPTSHRKYYRNMDNLN